MKEVFSYYARCNTRITSDMLAVIEKNGDSFNRETGGYFGSIASIIDHLYISNLNWLRDFCAVTDSGVKGELELIAAPAYGSKVFATVEEAGAGLLKTAYLTERLCDGLKEDDLEKELTKKRRNGEMLRKKVWKALIHYFNHQTHHRGQISEVLDELKIGNDYSNMIFIE